MTFRYTKKDIDMIFVFIFDIDVYHSSSIPDTIIVLSKV